MKKELQNIIIDTRRVHYGGYGRNNEKLYYEAYFFGEDYDDEIVIPVKRSRKEDKKKSEYFGDWGFSDRLQPLYRWIDKQHGRKWNDVFSEICKKVDRRNVRGRHLIEHVLDYVWTRDSDRGWRGKWFVLGFYKDNAHVDENGILIIPWHNNKKRGR